MRWRFRLELLEFFHGFVEEFDGEGEREYLAILFQEVEKLDFLFG
jgi:hypothetical protein